MELRTLAVGFCALPLVAVACGVGMSEAAAPVGVTARDEWASQAQSGSPSPSPDGGDCPHGRLEDPHRGFVRCLEPGEADAGLGFPAQPEPGDGGAPDAPADGPETPPADDGGGAAARAPVRPELEVGAPDFENGQVPRAAKFLASGAKAMATCIENNGGLVGKRGKLKLQFLVRARGHAEGVEILSSTGVTEEAGACIASWLKNRLVGPPTANPVGVTVTLQLKAP